MLKELECAVLTTALPEHGLSAGDLGTIVLVHGDEGYEVEFVTLEGETLAVVSLRPDQLRSAKRVRSPMHARLDGATMKLPAPIAFDAEAFVAEVKTPSSPAPLPRRGEGSRKRWALSAAALCDDRTQPIEPTRKLAAEAAALERQLGNLVNEAYNLTPEEIALMWQTAPPRMPFSKPCD